MNELKPCGTTAAYARHRRHGEPACADCLRAVAERSAAGRTSAVHLDRDGSSRCGQGSHVTADPSEVTCGQCQGLMNGTHGIGNTNRQPDQPCGTMAAYRRHYRHGEKPCWSCRQAERRYRQDLRRAA